MDVGFLLNFFIDALLRVEQPQPNEFKLTVWLLVQFLYRSQPEPEPVLSDSPLGDLRQEVTEFEEKLKDCLDVAASDEAKRKCIQEHSGILLDILEKHLPLIVVPDDWQVVWMGVEG